MSEYGEIIMLRKKILSTILLFSVISLCFLEYNMASIQPASATPNIISWSGYTWTVRDCQQVQSNPGSNYWSSSNVWVDENGWLHLKISNSSGKWYCAELASTQTFGYGTYAFYTVSRVDNLDKNIVLGLFAYKDDSHEVDVEYTKWGQTENNNGWFTVQPPPITCANSRGFNIQMCGDYATHYFTWSQKSVTFGCYGGHYAPGTAPSGNIISSFTSYKQVNPAGVHADINLWLFRGAAPSDGQSAEVVIKSFQYKPLK
jgi:hypothetical protein